MGRQDTAHYSLRDLWLRQALGAIAAYARRKARRQPRQFRARTHCISPCSSFRRCKYVKVRRPIVHAGTSDLSPNPSRHTRTVLPSQPSFLARWSLLSRHGPALPMSSLVPQPAADPKAWPPAWAWICAACSTFALPHLVCRCDWRSQQLLSRRSGKSVPRTSSISVFGCPCPSRPLRQG